MSKRREKIGERLAEIAAHSDISQTEIAGRLDVPISQVNRYFRGHNDIYASQLIRICKILGIDIEAMINNRLRALSGDETAELGTDEECLKYLFKELDEIGQQTYISSLMWAARVSRGEEFPKKVIDVVKKRCSLI